MDRLKCEHLSKDVMVDYFITWGKRRGNMHLPRIMEVAKHRSNTRGLPPREVLMQYCDIADMILAKVSSGKLFHLEVYSAVLEHHVKYPCLGNQGSCIYSEARNMS